jgi:hypothetical protein
MRPFSSLVLLGYDLKKEWSLSHFEKECHKYALLESRFGNGFLYFLPTYEGKQSTWVDNTYVSRGR